MKYIVVKHNGLELAILFDEILTHKDVAASHEVVSAGFCNPDGATWGKSISLNLSSRPEDGSAVRHALFV